MMCKETLWKHLNLVGHFARAETDCYSHHAMSFHLEPDTCRKQTVAKQLQFHTCNTCGTTLAFILALTESVPAHKGCMWLLQQLKAPVCFLGSPS